MFAIEIRHNGDLKATCGLEEFRQLSAMLHVSSSDLDKPRCEVECMGLRANDDNTDEVLRWVKKGISFGDEISFKVVETSVTQEPFDRQVIPKYGREKG